MVLASDLLKMGAIENMEKNQESNQENNLENNLENNQEINQENSNSPPAYNSVMDDHTVPSDHNGHYNGRQFSTDNEAQAVRAHQFKT